MDSSVWYIGAPRTGTLLAAKMFLALGAEARHQPDPKMASLLFGRHDLWPYPINKPPAEIAKIIDLRANLSSGGVESFWQHSLYFAAMIERHKTPDLVLIGVRDPVMQANSLKHMWNDPPWCHQDVDFFALLYRRMYRWIAEQARTVADRCRWVDFAGFAAGKYDDALRELCGGKADLTLIRSKKYNHRGNYPLHGSDLFSSCYEAMRQVKLSCEELGE